MKASFLQQQFKTYFSDGKELRNEAQSATDLITGLEAQYNDQLSKQGINVLVYGENGANQDYSGDVQVLQQKMVRIEGQLTEQDEKQNKLLELMNDILKNQKSLNLVTNDNYSRLENNQEMIFLTITKRPG